MTGQIPAINLGPARQRFLDGVALILDDLNNISDSIQTPSVALSLDLHRIPPLLPELEHSHVSPGPPFAYTGLFGYCSSRQPLPEKRENAACDLSPVLNSLVNHPWTPFVSMPLHGQSLAVFWPLIGHRNAHLPVIVNAMDLRYRLIGQPNEL